MSMILQHVNTQPGLSEGRHFSFHPFFGIAYITIMLSHRTKVILAFAAIYFIWGGTFLGVQIGLKSFPPFLFSALRLLVAGTALGLFCIARREPLPSLHELGKHALCGLIIFVGGIVLVVWAQQFISSSLASSIITTPFWFIILDKPQWKFYFSSKWIISGLLMSLIGVIMLMSFKTGRVGSASDAMQTFAILAMMIGSFMWVGGSLYLRYRPSKSSVYVSTAIQLLSAGVFCSLLSYFTGDINLFSFDKLQVSSVVAVLFLGLASSMLTFLAFMWLIKQRPPAIVSTYAYINPLVATLLGWGFANEHISGIQLLALGVILTGVLFVNLPKYLADRNQ